MNLFEQVADLLLESFDYNRENFQYDRRQRQLMEYQLASLRVDQVKLWREDIREMLELTPQKMEVYLLVIALELGFCVMALCKGRVPQGAPPWLIACHTLAICTAIVYLFLALWFGSHAFVSAQAYKVRILTQLVRLPVPTWKTLEASRTYGSSFEQQHITQMLRVPFVMGAQEGLRKNKGSPGSVGVDPWDLERRGDHFPELAPDVNVNTDKQKHIWLVREASKFFQTYDAFCRICMSAGTTSLATFFSYFCLSYLLTETAAPVPAWAGMAIFTSCTLVILRQDLMLQPKHHRILTFLMVLSPTLAGIVTFVSAKSGGNPGRWEYLIPLSLLSHGGWLFYYIFLFRVREVGTGAMLPMAFRSVLFLDAFACARHTGTWSRRLGNSLSLTRHLHASPICRRRSSGWSNRSNLNQETSMPAMTCADTADPRRPEDVECPRHAGGDSRPTTAEPSTGSKRPSNVSFKPTTFAISGDEDGQSSNASTGTGILGEKPGLVPWRTFLFNTVLLALLWWFSAAIALVNAYNGTAVFVHSASVSDPISFAAKHGAVLQGTRLETDWYTLNRRGVLPYPRGLACDTAGTHFATFGIVPGGRRGLVYGELSSRPSSKSSNVTSRTRGRAVKTVPVLKFAPAPPCEAPDADGNGVGERGIGAQDLALHGCDSGVCRALVLPRHGGNLLSCALKSADDEALIESAERPSTLGLARQWLDDRGGDAHRSRDTQTVSRDGLLQPEEMSAIEVLPCGEDDCTVVGTTAQRVVQMKSTETAVIEQDGNGNSKRQAVMAPWRLLREDHADALRSGSLASLNGGRLLAVLERDGVLRVLDVSEGGIETATWILSGDSRRTVDEDHSEPAWSAICAGGGAVFALADENSNEPGIWRFPLPKRNQRRFSSEASRAKST
eukprot:TRINITY_DN43138_c0_g1_i1.p1 TRINITY_DN43138_c0_g1~~TRINITY_DN43138_c0_g1_i1.p1  ORF type:complete len:899 (-),score=104.20 TRINITY_DN43138_c0_g1_i1:294-2990(-)